MMYDNREQAKQLYSCTNVMSEQAHRLIHFVGVLSTNT